jgi:hypothetical protein
MTLLPPRKAVMNIFDALPYVYRAFQREKDISEIIARLQPYVIMAQADRDLWPKISDILAYVFPAGGQAPKLPDVVWIQTKLNAWGHMTDSNWKSLAVDGKYGPDTHEAVLVFEGAFGLEQDQWFGLKCYATMCGWLQREGLSLT